MRALLGLMRENQQEVQARAAAHQELLEHASRILTILDPEVGEEELIQAVAAALDNLHLP